MSRLPLSGGIFAGVSVGSCRKTWQPSSLSSLTIESMSLRRGTDFRTVLPSAIRQAARIGSALFFEPEISTLPLRRVPPRMRKLSIAQAILGWGNEQDVEASEPVTRNRNNRRGV